MQFKFIPNFQYFTSANIKFSFNNLYTSYLSMLFSNKCFAAFDVEL